MMKPGFIAALLCVGLFYLQPVGVSVGAEGSGVIRVISTKVVRDDIVRQTLTMPGWDPDEPVPVLAYLPKPGGLRDEVTGGSDELYSTNDLLAESRVGPRARCR
jgi:hypothetical protein